MWLAAATGRKFDGGDPVPTGHACHDYKCKTLAPIPILGGTDRLSAAGGTAAVSGLGGGGCWFGVRDGKALLMRMWWKTRSSQVGEGCGGWLAGQAATSLVLVFDALKKMDAAMDTCRMSSRGVGS